MDCLLVVVSSLLASFLSFSDGANLACGHAGGFCKNRYEGCEKGKFKDGLCGGPDYYQCCVVKPIIDLEALNRPKWRICHECSYSVSRGEEKGSTECFKFNNQGQGSGMNVVNCTGMCSKELLKLDEENFELIRRCSNDCHSEVITSMHRVHCCWDELCNKAPGGVPSLPIISLAFLLVMGLWKVITGWTYI